MIQELNIRNIALIRQLSVSLSEGLNVLSGETGAGKSIIVDSVSLILGARADKELIKYGEEKAFVEALVTLPDSAPFFELLNSYGIEAEEDMIVSRELSASGKNVCRINGRMVPLNCLRDVVSKIINLHGQDTSREVLTSSSHLSMLDKYIGEDAQNSIEQIEEHFSKYSSLKSKLDEINAQRADKLRTMDMLSFQISEIESANLCVGEEDELLAKRKVMQNAEKILSSLNSAKENISGSEAVLERLYDALNDLRLISKVDESISETIAMAEDAYYTLEEVGEELSKREQNMSFEPGELDEIEERLELIKGLKRKYGKDEEEILSYLEEIKIKYEELDDIEYTAGELEKKIDKAESDLKRSCEKLSEMRKKTAKDLENKIDTELKELGMPAAKFSVMFTEKKPSKIGIDDVEFYVALNEGEPPKPLAKVASGGEASRIMLAFKGIMASKEDVGTLIFDEIDTGISGRMAKTVAQKMANIALKRQVICVSHLPQIAAMADENYLIEKSVDKKGTKTELKHLAEEEKEKEVARLSGGSVTNTALLHAKELIDECSQYKRKRHKN